MITAIATEQLKCYHCGEDCSATTIEKNEKHFCCEGCSMVYDILQQNGLCDYYAFQSNPGVNARIKVREDKFAFLDDASIANTLVNFKNENHTHIVLYLPQIHCSSCLWLLENIHKLNSGIISCQVQFEKKEVTIVFDHLKTTLRKVAETLTAIGYEPYISLQNMGVKTPPIDKSKIYKLGVAGFCFANIMLFSFPEYLGIDTDDWHLQLAFRYLSLLLSLPVVFYAATEFYNSAWKGLKHHFLNIDAPIVLAIVVTYLRSIVEIATNHGNGYLDSLSGIVFFMLAGRVLQDKTFASLNFERDYTAYFPIAVSKIVDGNTQSVALPNIKLNDTLLIHSHELIPTDGIVTRGKALIDYSFVTGESVPVIKEMGEIVYAGGKQTQGNIEILVIKEVAQSYLTGLWNKKEFKSKKINDERSFVHLLSRYFTWILFSVAAVAAIYWAIYNPANIANAVTAVLIVACPCALLLSNTFTNGIVLGKLEKNKFYLRNATVIEDIANANCIVFDKTGTLTDPNLQEIHFYGTELSAMQKSKIAALTAQSTHPLSKAINQWLSIKSIPRVMAFKEHLGKGIEGVVETDLVAIGSKDFITENDNHPMEHRNNSAIYVSIEGKLLGYFSVSNHYRPEIIPLIQSLQKKYPLLVISGDNDAEKKTLQKIFGTQSTLLFNQKPEDKLQIVQQLKNEGKKVLMIGDGLNDAGALQEANVGIALANDTFGFTPASDAILNTSSLYKLFQCIKFCKSNKYIVYTAFVVSILYNIVGLFFAVQGSLQPVVAAILMPCSSISILIITFSISNLIAWKLELK